jgi:hypothetical protein
MYICYLDESGTPEDSGTSHFVVLGLAIPAHSWKRVDREVERIKLEHRLSGVEIHTGWMMRQYPEQERISDFESVSEDDRRTLTLAERKKDLAKASMKGSKAVATLGRNYKKTEPYVHLTRNERRDAVRALAATVGSWDDAVLFADAQEKAGSRDAERFPHAFEQVVTRLHHYLVDVGHDTLGMLVQDNNQTAAAHLTRLMRRFHRDGTAFARIPRIIETPLFVDSELTSMVQMADLCSYAVRRFFENGEEELLDLIYGRFHRVAASRSKLVGLRHFTGKRQCRCRVCVDHGRRDR